MAGDEPKFATEPLGQHDRAAFSCGNELLDRYLQRQAKQDLEKGVAIPYVLSLDGKTIIGYYTLSQFAVQLDHLSPEIAKKLPKYPMVPMTLLGRLAVDKKYAGQRHGEALLIDALRRILLHSKSVASAGVIVDAKDADAAAFYKKYGFLELPKADKRLFLPIGTIQKLFE